MTDAGSLFAREGVDGNLQLVFGSDVLTTLPNSLSAIVGNLAAGAVGLYQFLDVGDLVSLLEEANGQCFALVGAEGLEPTSIAIYC